MLASKRLGARIIDLSTRIAPFGDPVGAVPFLGRSFDELRREEIDASGVRASRLTFADYAIATSGVLSAFAGAAPPGQTSVLALPAQEALRALAALSSTREEGDLLLYDVFLDARPGDDLHELREKARPVRVDIPTAVRRRELPRIGVPPHGIDVPSDGLFALHVEHWVHILWGAPLFVASLRARMRGRRVRGRGVSSSSVVGSKVSIHPTAFIEGSVLDEGAVVGARASVRFSYVGRRSQLADFTRISWSVLGEETHTLVDACLVEMVAFGRSTLANLLLKDSLLGARVFLTSGVTFWSDVLSGNVQVEHRGGKLDSGRKVLGGCAGHGSVLGARTIVAPGCAIPNHTIIVMRREEGVLRIADAPPGAPMCWRDGALMPVSEVAPGVVPEEIDRA